LAAELGYFNFPAEIFKTEAGSRSRLLGAGAGK
jgi:hypothetical protein